MKVLIAIFFTSAALSWQANQEIERARWLWRIWIEQARKSTVTMTEQAQRERAAYQERVFWQRGVSFQKQLNAYLLSRADGVEDLQQARRVQKAWRRWQESPPWPQEPKP
jgi:hypothetical protein